MADLSITVNMGDVVKSFDDLLYHYPKTAAKILLTAGNYMVRETKKRFDNQISPDGEPWKSIAPLTRIGRKGKGRARRGGKALLRTGMGKASIAIQEQSTFEARVGPSSMQYYLRWHQGGAVWTRSRNQAWWMVFNLWNFDPKNPNKFMGIDEEFMGEHGGKKAKGKAKKNLGRTGWRIAFAIANALEGSTAVIPDRSFAGINRRNADQIQKITERWIMRALRAETKAGEFTL